MRGQSREVQAVRLAKGQCPVHGLYMYQVDLTANGRYVAQCTRNDCGFRGTADRPFGPSRPMRACIHMMTVAREAAAAKARRPSIATDLGRLQRACRSVIRMWREP
jgi:hypothetical protein